MSGNAAQPPQQCDGMDCAATLPKVNTQSCDGPDCDPIIDPTQPNPAQPEPNNVPALPRASNPS